MKGIMEDRELLRAYLDRQSEQAFAELVARHINLVYSTALRHVREPETARDVAQTVFIHLARKGHAIRAGDALAGWLYRVTCYTAVSAVRAERRWRHRESQAVNPAEVQDTNRAWDALAPLLDEGMERLNRTEQDALVLRFFEGRTLRETGSALAMTEAAVQKRVSRALEKLRSHFARRGFSVSAGVIAATLTAHSTQAAPVGLAATLAGASISGTASVGLPWFFNSIQLMTATKLKLSVAALCLVAAVSTPIILQRTSSPPTPNASTPAPSAASSATTGQAPPPPLVVSRSVDDVVSGLQRLLTDGDYGRRYAGLKDLADSVALADIPNAILRADRLSDPLLKSPFILLLLSRLAQSNPALAMECAQRASTTHEGVRTVMDQWVQQDAAGARGARG
jgi:RNA polymerase sigma factor (sigma-70 family)